jgi:hypothetical protein
MNGFWCRDCQTVRDLNRSGRCAFCGSDKLASAAPPRQPFEFLLTEYLEEVEKGVSMSLTFTEKDLRLLKSMGISAGRTHDETILELARRIARHDAPGIPEDGTVMLLRLAGIPVTAENWLRLAFAGDPPTPPFARELAAQLPDWVRRAFDCGEDEA